MLCLVALKGHAFNQHLVLHSQRTFANKDGAYHNLPSPCHSNSSLGCSTKFPTSSFAFGQVYPWGFILGHAWELALCFDAWYIFLLPFLLRSMITFYQNSPSFVYLGNFYAWSCIIRWVWRTQPCNLVCTFWFFIFIWILCYF